MREYNKHKFYLQEIFDTPFDNWIEYYYDMDDCHLQMEEEREAQEINAPVTPN